MTEVRRAKNVILFIDELHTLVGAGGAEGAIDASNVLKPALSRGEVQCIGATTLDEYRKYIEKDGALERRFQIILVEPPSKDETYEILQGLKARYEEHHRVRYTDGALKLSIELATRYVSGRFLPDKAIDVIDEAGARVRLSSMTHPPDLKTLDGQIRKLDGEKAEAVQAQDFERAARLRDQVQKLKKERQQILEDWRKESREHEGLVDEEVVAETVSRVTGIPLTRIEAGEADRLLEMESEMRGRVVGQERAVSAVSRAVRRSRSGLKNPLRPMGSFVFLGPTGVGKTETARALAEFLFDDASAMVRIDMSEFMEKHSVSRLIGAPPGYVGYDEGGYLTEAVRRHPYGVVLFDEIEKAHPDVFNIFLQILDDGRLTDGQGRTVDFRNTVLVMTSNIGSQHIIDLGVSEEDEMRSRVTEALRSHFKPEFLNRIDDVVIFNPLGQEQIGYILEIQLDELRGRLAERRISLELSDEAISFLATRGYDPQYGARPLKRLLQREVQDPLAMRILEGEFAEDTTVRAELAESGEGLVFS